MKTIGLIGGMSWQSTAEYYRIINETVEEKIGGLHSARCVIYSFDFEEIEKLQHANKWKECTRLMIISAQKLESSGADCIIICTNTMHKMADEVQENINIPLLHIADVTAEKIIELGLIKVALLGTKFTMEEDFYKGRVKDKFGLDIFIPEKNECNEVHDIIYEELCRGKIEPASRNKYKKIIKNLFSRGAQGVILGCTEIPLLIKQEDSPVPIFDTTLIHAQAAVKFALDR